MAVRNVAAAVLVLASLLLSGCSSGSPGASGRTLTSRLQRPPATSTTGRLLPAPRTKSGRHVARRQTVVQLFQHRARAACKGRPKVTVDTEGHERGLRPEARWLLKAGPRLRGLKAPPGEGATLERYRATLGYERTIDLRIVRARRAQDPGAAQIGTMENDINRGRQQRLGHKLHLPPCLL